MLPSLPQNENPETEVTTYWREGWPKIINRATTLTPCIGCTAFPDASASRGLSQRAFCASEPYFTSTSMLPVSGALQLKTSGAIEERPVISARGAYSTLVRPTPYSWSGRNRFHKPAARALAFKVSITGCCFQRRQSGRCCSCAQYSGSDGRTSSCMKAERR